MSSKIQLEAKDRFKLLDVKKIQRDGLDLNFEIENSESGLELLTDELQKEYSEFFLDPLVLALIAKKAKVLNFNLDGSNSLQLDEARLDNTIVIVRIASKAKVELMLEACKGFWNTAFLIICEESSKLELVDFVDDVSQSVKFLYFKEAAVGNSKVFNLAKGYLNIKAFMCGRNAEHNLNLFLDVQAKRSYNFITNHFKVKDCRGEIYIDAVLNKRAYAKIIASINIDLKAANTESYLKKEIILLDDASKVDSVPKLEIKTNDVKAGHAVSITNFDKQKMFYLQSRGLQQSEALELLCNGLFRKVVDKIESEEHKNLIINFSEC